MVFCDLSVAACLRLFICINCDESDALIGRATAPDQLICLRLTFGRKWALVEFDIIAISENLFTLKLSRMVSSGIFLNVAAFQPGISRSLSIF